MNNEMGSGDKQWTIKEATGTHSGHDVGLGRQTVTVWTRSYNEGKQKAVTVTNMGQRKGQLGQTVNRSMDVWMAALVAQPRHARRVSTVHGHIRNVSWVSLVFFVAQAFRIGGGRRRAVSRTNSGSISSHTARLLLPITSFAA